MDFETLIADTPNNRSDHEISDSVTSEEAAYHIEALSDSLKPQLGSVFELMPGFKKEQSGRRHEEATSFTATSSSSSSGSPLTTGP